MYKIVRGSEIGIVIKSILLAGLGNKCSSTGLHEWKFDYEHTS